MTIQISDLNFYTQKMTVRAKIEPTPLGSISYEGEKSRVDPRVGSYGQFQKYAREKADPRVDPGISRP